MYHRHELFEWLNMHFECESISLQKCIYYLNEPAVLYFVEQGAYVNFIDDISPLNCALNEGLSGIIEVLINKGANVNEKDDFWFPLKQAVEDASYKEVSLLIDAGANVNEVDERGRTPSIIATNEGYFNIIKLLIEHGADVNACDETKKTSLFKASRW